jgi:hypothetical protein
MLKDLPNFGGIFYATDLHEIAIVDYPVGILIFSSEHWVAVYLDNDFIEVMDPLGFMYNSSFHFLHLFLKINMQKRELKCSPRIQAATFSNCGKYCIVYLFHRLLSDKNLTSFLKYFTANQTQNNQIIKKLFKEIKKRK